ncbi:hypothetical protein DL95DRAFT_396094, partial [Leptodontidium sp. 2 PMI_412]
MMILLRFFFSWLDWTWLGFYGPVNRWMGRRDGYDSMECDALRYHSLNASFVLWLLLLCLYFACGWA